MADYCLTITNSRQFRTPLPRGVGAFCANSGEVASEQRPVIISVTRIIFDLQGNCIHPPRAPWGFLPDFDKFTIIEVDSKGAYIKATPIVLQSC